jgi:hypothetical protein
MAPKIFMFTEKEAKDYLDKNRIPDFIKELATLVSHQRPENLRLFLLGQLQRMKNNAPNRVSDCVHLSYVISGVFKPCEIGAVFDFLDLNQTGAIPGDTARGLFKTFGLSHVKEYHNLDIDMKDTVSREAFIQIALSLI